MDLKKIVKFVLVDVIVKGVVNMACLICGESVNILSSKFHVTNKGVMHENCYEKSKDKISSKERLRIFLEDGY